MTKTPYKIGYSWKSPEKCNVKEFASDEEYYEYVEENSESNEESED